MKDATILVVDDKADNLTLISGLLKDKYKIKVANGGKKALNIAFDDLTIDLILLDIMMPEMDGYQVCECLKKDSRTAHIPVIFLTAKSQIDDETKGFYMGAVDYITKPINPPIMMARIKTHLKMKKMKDLLSEKAISLETANNSLIDVNIQKDRFLGVVSHDLRNPLSVISGYCDLLLTESFKQEEITEIVKTISISASQMYGLVTDLLDVSQVNLGKFTLNKELVELLPYMIGIVKTNQLLANRKKITLLLSPIDEKNFGYFDPNRIRQVITNLLTNAIKFSNTETSITLTVECDKENSLIFKVKDEGKGIKEDEIKFVFGEFQKTSTKSTAGEQSTGLGLAICRNIILAHEGEIKCESVVDQGSCFYFSIPHRVSEQNTITTCKPLHFIDCQQNSNF